MLKARLIFLTLSIILIGSAFWYVSKFPRQELIPSQFVNSHLKDYSKEEQSLIQDDLKNISDLCFRDCTRIYSKPIYVGTAGGPGASKSTILETYLHNKTNYVYADPDQRALKFMINTYISSCNNYAIANAASFKEVIKGAYEKWRAASNYIACTILNEAFAGGYNIAHGTTSTAKQITGLYEKLKAENYKIILLLCGTTDQNRVNAIRGRGASQDFIQNSDEDTIQKGKAFPERFADYFKYADEIHLYWTETFSKGSVLAAIYDAKSKKFLITNQAAFDSFLRQYSTIAEFLPEKSILSK